MFTFFLSKILMTFFFSSPFFTIFTPYFFIVIGLLNVVITPLHLLLCIHPFTPFYVMPPHPVLHVSTLKFALCSRNNKYSVNHLFLLNSSLHKQPFITAHFRSSLHILCITAH